MARKKQKIAVVVHVNENIQSVFTYESVQQFWTEKIVERLQRECITNEEIGMILGNIIDKGK